MPAPATTGDVGGGGPGQRGQAEPERRQPGQGEDRLAAYGGGEGERAVGPLHAQAEQRHAGGGPAAAEQGGAEHDEHGAEQERGEDDQPRRGPTHDEGCGEAEGKAPARDAVERVGVQPALEVGRSDSGGR